MADKEKTPRLDRLEARLAKLEQAVAAVTPDERDVPKDDGLTDRERWFKLCQGVVDQAAADGRTISLDEANDLLVQLPEFGGQAEQS